MRKRDCITTCTAITTRPSAGTSRPIPSGKRGGINVFNFALNNPLFWADPFGLRSFLVARRTNASVSGVNVPADHMFIATNADYVGDPNADIISFGQDANGNLGPNNDPYRDADIWQRLAGGVCPADPDAGANNPALTEIPASDDAVAAAAASFVADQDYAAAAGPFGSNSNSAAQAVANKAAGTDVPTPSSGSLLGPHGSGNASKIHFR